MIRDKRRRLYWALTYYLPIGLATLGLTALYAGLVAAGSLSVRLRVLTTAAIAVLFLVTSFYCFLALLYEEDWWDDFKDQNRLLVMTALTLVGALLAGVWIGWWIGY